MKRSPRYTTTHLSEDQYEPGSQKRVLKNLLGIMRKREMDILEAKGQLRTLNELVKIYDSNHKFTAKDICAIHKMWLGLIYPWAGQYRSVNISRGGFAFAAAREIPKLMEEFENNILAQYTPCRVQSVQDVANALSNVHVEFVLIHPFREGNGRMARLLSIVMALQAGMPVLDFGNIKGAKKKEYFSAVQAGLLKNYRPMAKLFEEVIIRSLKRVSLRG